MKFARSIAAWIIAGASLTLVWQLALAQVAAYPSRTVRIVVPFPPGGATDAMTRTVAQKLNDLWQQAVIIENRAGSGGIIGADAVVRSPADGYTILAATIAHAANATLVPKASYRFERDLRIAAIMGLIPLVPVVRADSEIRSLQGLVAQSSSRALNAGSSGNGSASHLGLELFKRATGARIQHVPYKGGAPAMQDLLGGQIDVIFALLPECLPHIRSGKLRPLAVTSETRSPLLPDVPTVSEAGVQGIEITSWNGLMVPSGTSSEIVATINADVGRVLSTAEMKKRIVELGFQPVTMTVAEADRFVKTDTARWARLIHDAGITVD
jgi:tripartite-type tricarboxylate transporter receptor subunit TctC